VFSPDVNDMCMLYVYYEIVEKVHEKEISAKNYKCKKLQKKILN